MKKLKSFLKQNWVIFPITLVAAVIRFYQLSQIPFGLHGDEAWTGLDAERILKEGWIGPYVGSGLGQPTGPLYWTALIFKLFGINLFTLRASMALLGIFTIPALYFLSKLLFNHRVAVLATIFLTFSYWHLHFSRVAFMLISAPLIECLSLIFLFRALDKGKKLNWAAAGILTGLGIYTYNTYPVFVFAIGLMLWFIFLREKNKRQLVGNLLIFAISFFLIVLPFLKFALDSENNFLGHHQLVVITEDAAYKQVEINGGKIQFLIKKFVAAVSIFNVKGGIDFSDALGARPLLDPFAGVLFVGGALISLWKIKDRRYSLLLLVIIISFIPLILTTGGESRRVITALPFSFILAALPAAKLWEFFNQSSLVGLRFFGRMLVLFVCLFVAGYNLNYYFNDLVKAPETKWVFCYDLVKTIEHLKTFPHASTFIYFYSNRWSYNYETRRFLLPNLPGEDRSYEFGKFGIERINKQGVVYLLMPPYEKLVDEIKKKSPGGEYQEFHDDDRRLMFVSYYLKSVL
ncbi:MAG: glycosyltransferase family 39 protein [Candidatus Cloacimonetes bacterium]|nr:glycosyltransferase family 39 protein [Candidatus Cloacimonadota bacterium]